MNDFRIQPKFRDKLHLKETFSENCKEKIHGRVLLYKVAGPQLVNALTKDSVMDVFHQISP